MGLFPNADQLKQKAEEAAKDILPGAIDQANQALVSDIPALKAALSEVLADVLAKHSVKIEISFVAKDSAQ